MPTAAPSSNFQRTPRGVPVTSVQRASLLVLVTREGLRATARRAGVSPATILRASRGESLSPLALRAVVRHLTLYTRAEAPEGRGAA